MRLIVGGTFWMGGDDAYAEEAPQRRMTVDSFFIDETPVTNRQFARFIEETGHVTTAEIAPDSRDYPDADPAMLQAGSSLFVSPPGPVPLSDPFQWWTFSFGTNWRHPHGPDSDLRGLEDHPVVHVAHSDAVAFALWAGKQLPTEAQWEFAARGGLDRAAFAWGDEFEPGGVPQAKYWQGRFPWQNRAKSGWSRTAPVRSFPPNGFGLYDMIGNVWEWTDDWYVDRSAKKTGACCISPGQHSNNAADNRDNQIPGVFFGRKVLKGGSHLCASNYCQRYRPAARYAQDVDSPTSHIGFRCVVPACA
ncbi:formylglycine-generating enzyme family protein [Massilia cavernae]|uniref:Formylglycine-generating enzyme family protein n=2 Tax=Massilia cavernae TaxID=2320864 RepID=A0A418XGN7_9BURK|nr:formylglycine-generating enzyme family protein [Massilia cavernae]